MNVPRFVLYTRVSTQAQDSNNSHPTQLAALEAYTDKRGGEVVEVIRETASGGAYLGRPGIRRAIELLESDEADVLACYDFSRYSRDEEHQQAMLRRIERMGKRLEFTTLELARDEDGNLTPEGALMFGVSGSFAAYHRAKIKADSTRGMINAARRGQQPHRHKQPYGYRIIQTAEVKAGLEPPETLGTYRIIEEQAQVVREIFALRCNGETSRAIARELTRRGTPPPKSITQWTDGTVKNILKRRTYHGEAAWRQTRLITDEGRIEQGMGPRYRVPRPESERIVIPCPPIVSRETWDAAQAINSDRARGVGRKRTAALLTGILRCPRCGAGMVCARETRLKPGVPSKKRPCGLRPKGEQPIDPARFEKRPFYHCGNSRHQYILSIGQVPCPRQCVEALPLEKRVLTSLREALSQPDFARLMTREKESESNAEVRAQQARLEELMSKRKNIVSAQVRAIALGIDPSVHEELLVEISRSIAEVQARLGTTSTKSTPRGHLLAVAERMAQMMERIEDAPPGGTQMRTFRALMGIIIERIDFDPHADTISLHFV